MKIIDKKKEKDSKLKVKKLKKIRSPEETTIDIENIGESKDFIDWNFTKKREINKIVFTDGKPYSPGTMIKGIYMEEMKKEKKSINIYKDCLIWLMPIIFPFLLNIFFYGISINFYFTIYLEVKGMLLEILFIYLFSAILFGILKKGKRVITTIGIIFLVLSMINLIKYMFMGEPILFKDILYINAAGEIFGIVEGEFFRTILFYIWPIIIKIILFVIFIFIGRKVWGNLEVSNKKARINLIIIPIIILILLFAPIKFMNNFIIDKVFEREVRKDYASFTRIEQYYHTYGVLGGMYGQLLEDRIYEPEDYDEEIIEKELSNVKENEKKIFGKPNIIVVLSESFWDIEQLEEIEFNKSVTPNFNKLKEEGLFFNMITPQYGGITANVEYEFLTGSNLMYFNHTFIPYMQLYNNDKYYDKPSIIEELRNSNYRTKITTTVTPQLFNCSRFYKYLKVDETEYISDTYLINQDKLKGQYISDEFITNQIIDEFNNKEDNEKLYYMVATMQAHMPYPIDKYENYDVWVTNNKYDDEINNTLTSYAQGIYDADKELGRLYEYIQTLKEPTIIVFFGDHLPYLYSGKENVIDKLEYFNTEDDLLNTYRKYNTQALILSNFEIENKENVPKYLGPDLLMVYVLNNMEIEISNYYKWLYSTKDIISSANYLVTIDKDGKLYNTFELDGKLKELYDLRRNIEYKLFIK